MITKNLKKSTKELHAETEKAMNAKRIFALSFNVSEYIEILQTLFLAHQQIEQELGNVDDGQFQSLLQKHYAHRAGLIERDLLNLGGEKPTISEKLIGIENQFQAYGALYVLKGSTLGGKFIYQQLEKTTADWPETSLHFYGYEKDYVMENWQAYCDDFNALSFSVEEENEIIKGAQITFEAFIEATALLANPSKSN